MNHAHRLHDNRNPSFIFNCVLVGFLLVAGYFLVMEHKAHLEGALQYLPYLLLLACPLMHLFMHHGHGGHGEHASPKDDQGDRK